MKIDLTKIYKKYKGLWVVLDENLKKVVSSDKNAEKAYKKASEQGYKKPTLFKVPKENLPYFGLIK
mgnify:CR=1 FL=1